MNGYRDFNNSWAYPTQAERDAFQKIRDAQTPRQGQPSGEPPFGLGQFFKNLNNPAPKKLNNSNNTQTNADKAKTPAERVAACQARIRDHIARVNAQTNIPAAEKTAIIAKLNAKLADCTTPHGLDKEEKDKNHKDADPRGHGRLVSQITPGKLKQNPNILASLLQQIIDFFRGKQNIPTPVENVLKNYPQPPYSGTTVPPITPSV